MINHKQGFTLIELTIAISVSVLLLLVVTATYLVGQKTYNQTDSRAEIIQNGRVIIDRLSREIRQTSDIITELPPNNNTPEVLPDGLTFQDGHETNQTKYIRYYLEDHTIKRQEIIYYFPEVPDTYVYWHETNQEGNPPIMKITDDRIIGEYIDDIEFWGDKLININLYLSKNEETQIINTAIYGRNL